MYLTCLNEIQRTLRLSLFLLSTHYFFYQIMLMFSVEISSKQFGYLTETSRWVFLTFVLAFDFCRFCVVIRFFHHRHSDFEGFLYQILSITLFSYLNFLEKEAVFPFLMFSAKQGIYLVPFL